MDKILITVDFILYIIMTISVGYFFVFAFSSLVSVRIKYPTATIKNKFIVLIPSYKGDNVIMESIHSLLNQEYPKDRLDIIVISDRMKENTNEAIKKLPVKLLEICPENSSKAYALNLAIEKFGDYTYNVVVVLDADNIVEKDFILNLNNAYHSGAEAIQAHRTAKNTNTDIAILDALSEEINNSIFRLGHVNMGLSSSLIGSGMAFDYKLFEKNVKKLKTAGEDKELEAHLLKERVFIDYLEHVYVYDEKTQKADAFSRQRRRWLASQYGSMKQGLKDLPEAILSFNIDYIDKIIQWLLLPRVLVLGVISILSVLTVFFDLNYSIKWWILLIILMVTFIMSAPVFISNPKNFKAIKTLPLIFFIMTLNLFRLRGVNKKFIHTNN